MQPITFEDLRLHLVDRTLCWYTPSGVSVYELPLSDLQAVSRQLHPAPRGVPMSAVVKRCYERFDILRDAGMLDRDELGLPEG